MRILVVGRQYLPHFVLDFACQRLEEKRLRQLPSFLPKKSQAPPLIVAKTVRTFPFSKRIFIRSFGNVKVENWKHHSSALPLCASRKLC